MTETLHLITIMNEMCNVGLYQINPDGECILDRFIYTGRIGKLIDYAFDMETKSVFTLNEFGDVNRCFVGEEEEKEEEITQDIGGIDDIE